MSDKSRVTEYSDLRKKISQMDVYSFSETPTLARNVPEANGHHSKETTVPDGDSNIKRNSLSLSVEDLLRNYDNYESETQIKENRKRVSRMGKNQVRSNFSFVKVIPWILIGLLIIAVCVFVIMVLLMGVLK